MNIIIGLWNTIEIKIVRVDSTNAAIKVTPFVALSVSVPRIGIISSNTFNGPMIRFMPIHIIKKPPPRNPQVSIVCSLDNVEIAWA